MDFSGITWLDWVMAAVTVVGLFVTWRQARAARQTAAKAVTAANAAKSAVATTRAQLMSRDLTNELRLIRETIKDATRAIEDEDVPVSKHVLVQLAEMLHRAVALSTDSTTPAIPEDLVKDLQAAATSSSGVKEAIAKAKTPKPSASARELSPILVRLTSSIVQYETIQKYAVPEASNGS